MDRWGLSDLWEEIRQEVWNRSSDLSGLICHLMDIAFSPASLIHLEVQVSAWADHRVAMIRQT